ncbi:MAG: Ig-like domain-containing protein, partial [Anaerolineae bacterium]|nr:Ig-like domain-containing protein [Anaerolineae bacterium]
VILDNGGEHLAALIFSVDIDQRWLHFDPADANNDGAPDAVAVHVPGAFVVMVGATLSDTAGELDFTVLDLTPPLAALPSGALFTLTLTTGEPLHGAEAAIRFAGDPPISASNEQGHAVSMSAISGSVTILGPPALITVTTQPTTLLADGISTATVIAQIGDSQGRLLPDATVYFTTSAGTISPAALTNTKGQAVSVLTTSTAVGTAQVTATAGAIRGVAAMTFTVGPAASVQITATPKSLYADGVSTSTLTATVTDAWERPLVGQTAKITTTLGILSALGVTNEQGRLTTILTAGVTPGVATVRASAGRAAATTTVILKSPTGPSSEHQLLLPIIYLKE